MKQEEKDLLLKDLCSMSPYGIIVECNDNDGSLPNVWKVAYINVITEDVYLLNTETTATKLISIEDTKPYLFPLSSMTEEQKNEFNTKSFELQLKVIDDEIMHEESTEFEVDFYNKHHFDWRGLIPMGLAKDATGLNIY